MINTIVEFVFGAALFINALLFIPQSIRIFRERTAQSVSLTTFVGLLLIQLAIVLHGIIVHDPLLIWGYVISMVTTGLVVVLTIKYRNYKVESDTSGLSFEEILMQLPGHIYWKDKNSVMLGCNANNFQDFGLKSLRDFIGKTDYDLFCKEEADCLRLTDEEVMRTGQTKIVEEEVTIANGEKVVYLSHKKPLRNNKNEIIGTIGTTVDITAAKQEMVDRLYMLEGIIAVMPGMVYWMDKKGVYLGCNDNEAKVIGLSSRNDIVGKKNIDLPGFLISEVLDPVNQKVMETGETITLEEPAILSDGTEAVFISSKVPLRNSRKEITGLLGISIDITERKKQEQKLIESKEAAEAANQAKTEFVQNMQHDIRTPSAGLWGVLDVLAKTELDSDRKEALDMAVAASKRLLDLCNEAVEFGDLSGNTKPVVQKSLDVRALARSVIELNLPAAFAKDLVINFKVAASVPLHIASDEFRLSRILINLLGNAIKFSHQGEITLSMDASVEEHTRKGLLRIELRDMGIGIAADKVNTIFEKFTRGVASNMNKYSGTGLGLYVVKTFVDELNGDVYIESHENEGTYFKINIPFKALLEELKKPGVEIEEQFKSTIQQNAVENQGIKVKHEKKPLANTPFAHELLIIEDDKTCLFAEKNLLSAFTSHIDTAENVVEALEKLASKRYDLVISDLGLPDGSGNDIVAKVKANLESPNYNTPFVAMTAHQDALKHQQAKAAGFTATNTKPLGSEKATELLNTYSAQGAGDSLQETAIPSRTEDYPVIDLALGMKRTAAMTENQAIEVLGILWETLQVDIPLLRLAEENNDIEAANALLLKIRGGLCYTGAPRLEAACEALYNEAKSGIKDLRKIHGLFSVLYDESKLFVEQYKEHYERL